MTVAELSTRQNVHEAFDTVCREFGGKPIDVVLIGCGSVADTTSSSSADEIDEDVKPNRESAAAEAASLVSLVVLTHYLFFSNSPVADSFNY